ncbi:MAG: hypothetical protein AAGJ35_16000, partial [Myxococcota bacterium]
MRKRQSFESPWANARLWMFLLSLLTIVAGSLYVLGKSFINVPEGHLMVLIRKTGKPLSPNQIITQDPSQKGIALETYGEGWHLLNPYTWEAKIVRKTEVPPGKVGIKIRLFGSPLQPSQIIAGKDAKGRLQKGIMPGRLTPGRYSINPYAYKLELHPKVTVPPGHLGV